MTAHLRQVNCFYSVSIVACTLLVVVALATAQESPPAAGPIAYDSWRSVTVLFSGLRNDGETWEWDGDQWSLMTTEGPYFWEPPAMAFDSRRGVTVHYGPVSYDWNLRATWEWDGSQWTEVSTVGPRARSGHALAFDSARGTTVLFGGADSFGRLFGDTWEWDGDQWQERSSTGPQARVSHALAYDNSRNVTVLFGGSGGGDELWEWNGVEWLRRFPSGNRPSGRDSHAMAYDRARATTVLFGGWPSLDDTWEWDGFGWNLRNVDGPPGQAGHSMAYDSRRLVTVLFGGNGTWEWDGVQWQQRDSERLPPPPSRFLPYPGAGTSLSYFDPQSHQWRNDYPISQITREPLVLLMHGWRSDASKRWITDFVTAAYDPVSGTLANRPEVQVIAVNWPQRAQQGEFWDWKDAWRGGRNGFADGAAFGWRLAEQFYSGGVNPEVVHIIGHSNGGGFGAGIAWMFLRRTSWRIAQMTTLDSPSVSPFGWFEVPPTGYLIQQVSSAVAVLDSWYDDEHANHGDSFGDQFVGDNVSAFDLSESRTKRCMDDGSMHTAISLRYARSASTQRDEAFGFSDRSAALHTVSAEGLSRERFSLFQCASPETEWERLGSTFRGPSLAFEEPLEFISSRESWYGDDAYATGSPPEPSFVLRGDKYLSVEFQIDAMAPVRAISFRVDLVGHFQGDRDRLFVYMTEGGRDEFEFVAARDLDSGSGSFEDIWLPGAPEAGVVTVAIVIPDNGRQVEREIQITQIQPYDVMFGID